MKIVNVSTRELTKNEMESIERFRFYTDGVSFACIGERVMVMLADEESKDIEKLKSKTREHIKQALSEPPDINAMEMEDGCQLVYLESGVFAFTMEKAEHEFGVHISLRNECLEACEKGEILAIAYEKV